MPEKQPTDSAIIKGFEKFEQGFNVAMAWFRIQPRYHDGDYTRETLEMWLAHKVYRNLAVAAHERIEAKKGKKDAQ